MEDTWTPLNITNICSEQQTNLTQCSPTGIMYLSLLTQLFSGVKYSTENSTTDVHKNYDVTNDDGSSPIVNFCEPNSIIAPGIKIEAVDIDELRDYYLNSSFSEGIDIGEENTKRKRDESGVSRSENSDSNYRGNGTKINAVDPSDILGYYTNSTNSEFMGFGMDNKKKKRENSEQVGEEKQTEEYDFIIIGAGSAGCVLANRLTEIKEWKVLLIEAGPEEPDITMVPSFPPVLQGSSIDWEYTTQPDKLSCRSRSGQTCSLARGKTMGGSSAINSMVYTSMRGHRRDYDHWAELGNVGWSYREILPYFKKSENNQELDNYYHSTDGPLNVETFSYIDIATKMLVEALNETGLPIKDLTSENNLGTNIAQSTSKDGRRVSANVAFVKPIRYIRPNFLIIVNAYVTKVLINSETKTAYGITYIKNGTEYSAYAAKEVIISCGVFNSPKLLMLSGIGPKNHLGTLNITVLADLKVGQNLQDHVTTEALLFSLNNESSTLVNNTELTNEIYKYKNQYPKKYGSIATTSTINSKGFIKTKNSKEDAPDIQFRFDGRNVEDFYSDPATYLDANIFPHSIYNGVSAKPVLLVPQSRGLMLLNSSDPIYGKPLIFPRFFTVKEDLDTLIEALCFLVSLENTDAFKRIGASYVKIPIKGCTDYVWGTYDYFVCLLTEYTGTTDHPAGTCKMGPAYDKEAVVDPRLRVYGIEKLRVVDSSTMTQVVRGNLNAPTMMMAEKASDMIKEDWCSY